MIKISITQTDKGNKTVDESAADRSEAPKLCCPQHVGYRLAESALKIPAGRGQLPHAAIPAP